MPGLLRIQLGNRLLRWGSYFQHLSAVADLPRRELPLLIVFHGYSLAHTLRPLVIARSLRKRGYQVVLAGCGPHVDRVRQEGFLVHDVETLPQEWMDQQVALGQYGYYDVDWIDRCVKSERQLLRALQPALVIHDMKPTVSLSTRLEGVDEVRITQAYNQPGYPAPISLMDRFSLEVGPFAEYLARHAHEVRPQRSFQIMADIPQFHPPGSENSGYHYAGPLLERPPEPRHLPVLDAGWDNSLPLIYLTCGSSGRPPDYLEEVLAAFSQSPYRLLVTTAGRWQGTVEAPNIRVVDFIPGEWVLRRAQLLVGVVGIGAIYQALSCGVPIIGAPEHLDQEYHLQRVEALGLGIKLDRRDFNAGKITAAVAHVLSHFESFKQRCAPFVRHLSAWDGGETVTDLIDTHFTVRRRGYSPDRAHLVEEEEFIRYLDTTAPAGLPREQLPQLLREGIRRGLPHQRQGKALFFDQMDSWNWLYDHDSRFFGADYRALEQKRQHFFSRQEAGIKSRSTWQEYRVAYRYRIFSDDRYAGERFKMFLPYPVPRENHQENIRLLSCAPEHLEEHFSPSLGFFYGCSFIPQGEGPWDFSYTCELQVREQPPGSAVLCQGLSASERQQYLELEPELLAQPEVVEFRRCLPLPEKAGDQERARAIYQALVRSKRFKKTKDRAQNLTYCTVAVLQDSGAHCITLARAFIALCRAEGVPAREVSGALLGYPAGEGRYAVNTWGEPIFGHTWAEVFLAGKGWVPVEFHGIVIAAGAMTQENVDDPSLRARILENSAYLDYYFGNLDNHRLICSNSVKRLPQCLMEHPEAPVGDRKRWQVPPQLRFACQLQVECL